MRLSGATRGSTGESPRPSPQSRSTTRNSSFRHYRLRLCGGAIVVVFVGLGVRRNRWIVTNQQWQSRRQGEQARHSEKGQGAQQHPQGGDFHHSLVLQIQDLYPFNVEEFNIVPVPSKSDEEGGEEEEEEEEQEDGTAGAVVFERKPESANDDSFSTTQLRQCVTVRRGNGNSTGNGGIGWIFVEDVLDFACLHHLFHYIEFLVIANAVLGDDDLWQKPTRWIQAPHYALHEVFGSNAGSLHHLVTQAVLGMGSLKCLFAECKEEELRDVHARLGPVQMYGREVNDHVVRSIHPSYHDPATWHSKMTPIMAEMHYIAMLEHVDTVILISRRSCPHGGINKMWFAYMDTFPAERWYEGIHRAVQQYKQLHLQEEEAEENDFFRFYPSNNNDNDSAESSDNPRKIVVTYVDRQDSQGRHLSPADHEWIVNTFSQMEGVDFRQVQMHKFTGIQQMVLGHDSHALMGCHGNGMTHQFWMKPQSLVVEFFWNFPFQYDYFTAARIMRHDYVGIFQGQVMDIPENATLESSWLDPHHITDLEHKDDDSRSPFERLSQDAPDEGHLTETSRDVLLQKVQLLVQQQQQQREQEAGKEEHTQP